MANIKDVARLAGVSISTVSRVLNSSKNVSPELHKKVMDAVRETEYSANIFAKGLKGSKSGIIAVVLTAISRTFFTAILEGIHEVAEANGYSILITETYDDVRREMKLVTELASQWVDGIILASSAYTQREDTSNYVKNLHLLSKKETPIPVITLEFPLDNPHVDAVVIDSRRAAYDATTRLIEQFGRKDIVHLSLPENHFLGQQRIEGFKQAMIDHGLPLDENSVINGNYSPYSGYEAMERLFKTNKKLDAVFSANDEMAIGLLKSCAKHNVRIPEEVAVIGNDDIFAASIVSPTLSSISVPKKEMGIAAAEKLFSRIREGGIPKEREIISLDYTIVDRQSTIRDRSLSFKYLSW